MPVVHTGPTCARPGCRYPVWSECLCNRCWRLANMFGRDPEMFAYEPLHGWGDERATVEFPWDRWIQEAEKRGLGVADLFVDDRSRRGAGGSAG